MSKAPDGFPEERREHRRCEVEDMNSCGPCQRGKLPWEKSAGPRMSELRKSE